MSAPLAITDPRLVKAYNHPLRIRILALLDDRVASPREIAAELDVPLSNISYHVRKLRSLGLIELVARVSRRGAIEHRYTARYHPVVSDEEWGRLPRVVRRTYTHGMLDFGWGHVRVAAEEGGFDRPDIHYSRLFGRLDAAGWAEIADELKRTLSRVEQSLADSERRIELDGDDSAENSTIILMHFGGPAHDLVGDGAHLDGLRSAGSAAIRAAMPETPSDLSSDGAAQPPQQAGTDRQKLR